MAWRVENSELAKIWEQVMTALTAPGTWVDALPEALARLREHDLVLRGPSGGFYRYDPHEVPGKVD